MRVLLVHKNSFLCERIGEIIRHEYGIDYRLARASDGKCALCVDAKAPACVDAFARGVFHGLMETR